MSQPPTPGQRSIAVLLSSGAAVVIFCVVGVGAISAPKFMRFQDQSRQSECKSNLRTFATVERALFAAEQRYSTRVAGLGWLPERNNRYLYRLGPGPLSVRATREPAPLAPGDEGVGVDTAMSSARAVLDVPPTGPKPGLRGTCPACELTMVCAGNLDDDDTLDVWALTLSSLAEGDRFVAVTGELQHVLDDTAE